MERMNKENDAIFEETIQKCTGEIMNIPSFLRGNVLADAELLAGGNKKTHAFILGLVYGTVVSGAIAMSHITDKHEAGIVTGNLPVLLKMLHMFAEEKRKADTTIRNLTDALAILNRQEEGE